MQVLGWAIGVFGALAFGGLLWWQGFAAAPGHLYGSASAGEEAAYCLAVVERIHEVVGARGDPMLRAHLDEQLAIWRPRAGPLAVKGRIALARDTSAPDVNEGAHLHLAVQDCAQRAVAFYGHRFAAFD